MEEGSLVSFMWKRNELFYLSEPGEVWDDGTVYWDVCSTQTCLFKKISDHGDDAKCQETSGTVAKAKYVKLFVQMVPVGSDGLPTDYGTTIASGYVNLSRFVNDSFFENEEEDTEDKHDVQIPMRPGGFLNLRIYLLNTVTGCDNVDVTSDSVTPTVEYVDGHVNGTPVLKTGRCGESGDAPCYNSPSPLSSTFSSSIISQSEGEHCSTRDSKPSFVGVDQDVAHLQKKLKKLTKQCEEARARAFSEASVSLQRGIEIDNLKRAKDVLLRRLETAEQQLMTMMKQDLAMTIQDTRTGQVSTANMDAVVHALAETKVALAEKEFESMELQGKLRAREAHIEALTLHLNAIHQKAELDSAQNSLEIPSLSRMVSALKMDGGHSDQADSETPKQGATTTNISGNGDMHAKNEKPGTVVHVSAVAL